MSRDQRSFVRRLSDVFWRTAVSGNAAGDCVFSAPNRSPRKVVLAYVACSHNNVTSLRGKLLHEFSQFTVEKKKKRNTVDYYLRSKLPSSVIGAAANARHVYLRPSLLPSRLLYPAWITLCSVLADSVSTNTRLRIN